MAKANVIQTVGLDPVTDQTSSIIMTPINELYLASEAPKDTDLSVRDSSRGSPMTDAELKASIYNKGIIYPLFYRVVSGRKYVVAGNRRLKMLREIYVEAPSTLVQTRDIASMEGDWREIAMDTNIALPPHIVERYEVIVALQKDLKLSPKDAQLRFGLTDRQFNQVMSLGKLSPKIRQLWKDAAIDAKTAQMFTLEPDPKEQDRIYESALKASHNRRVTDWDIKGKIMPQNMRDAGRLVAFVGVDACRKAKVLKQEDLFSNNHIVTDLKALNKLSDDKLDGVCQDLLKAGWSWAVTEGKIEGSKWTYGDQVPDSKLAKPTKEEAAQLAALQLEMDDEEAERDYDDVEEERDTLKNSIDMRGYTEAQRKRGGCFVSITQAGDLKVEYGKIKPEQKKSVAAAERSSTKTKAKKAGTAVLTNALAQRLSEQLQGALVPVLAANHHVAVAAMIAGFASSGHTINVKAGHGGYDDKAKQHFLSVFEGALKAKPEAQLAMLASIASEALSIVTFNGAGPAPISDPCLQLVVGALKGADVSKSISDAFDEDNYFASMPASVAVAAVRAAMGPDHAAKVAKMKKPDAAKFAAANVPEKGWLPRELRTSHYKGPTETKATPKASTPKKKIPAKKTAKAKAKKK